MFYLSRKQLNSNGIISWFIQFKPEQEKLYQLQIGDDLIIDLPQSIYLFIY